MQRVHEHYPDDAEAAIFYALALNGAVDFDDKNYTKQLKAAAILNEANSRIGTSLDVTQTAAELTDVAVPMFCDEAAVYLLDSAAGPRPPSAGKRLFIKGFHALSARRIARQGEDHQ